MHSAVLSHRKSIHPSVTLMDCAHMVIIVQHTITISSHNISCCCCGQLINKQ